MNLYRIATVYSVYQYWPRKRPMSLDKNTIVVRVCNFGPATKENGMDWSIRPAQVWGVVLPTGPALILVCEGSQMEEIK
mgnify:CR=1 FL=1